jgi:hypothetical protein
MRLTLLLLTVALLMWRTDAVDAQVGIPGVPRVGVPFELRHKSSAHPALSCTPTLPCVTNADCCDGSCVGGSCQQVACGNTAFPTCGGGTCAAGQVCQAVDIGCQCVPSGSPCSGCNLGPCPPNKTCGGIDPIAGCGRSCCGGLHQACSGDADCCNFQPCQSGECCRADQLNCISDSDCCGGRCSDGFCRTCPTTCSGSGDMCCADSDCCAGPGLLCNRTTCATCRSNGLQCSAPGFTAECCGGRCAFTLRCCASTTPGGTCSHSVDCCPLGSNTAPFCFNGVCSCQGAGTQCNDSSSCCDGLQCIANETGGKCQ